MKILKTFFYLFMFSAMSATAAPVYLTCKVAKSDTSHMEITLDESLQQVSYSVPKTGLTQKVTGIFSSDKVFFVSHPRELSELQYTINRVDLSIKRVAPSLNLNDTGKCSIVKTPKGRQF